MQLLIKPECCSFMWQDCGFHTSRLNASSCNKYLLVAYHFEPFLSLSLLSLSCMSRRDACREACRAGSSGFTPGKVPRMEFSAAESSRICARQFQTSDYSNNSQSKARKHSQAIVSLCSNLARIKLTHWKLQGLMLVVA